MCPAMLPTRGNKIFDSRALGMFGLLWAFRMRWELQIAGGKKEIQEAEKARVSLGL